jgi:hypothetical protein
MGHQRAYLAAADGKLPGNKANRMVDALAIARRLIFAAITLFVAAMFMVSVSGSASYAQSGVFAGMAGTWSGGGTITLDDGSTERIRCRASYAIGANGAGLNQTLVCASDGYKFDLKTNVVAEAGSLTGTWSEGSRGINGNLEGRGSNGSFQVIATAPGFTASISLATHGNKQSVVIRPESQFKGASISLTRS